MTEAKQDAQALQRIQGQPLPEWEAMTREQKDAILENLQRQDRERDSRQHAEFLTRQSQEAWEKICPVEYRKEIDLDLLKDDERQAKLRARLLAWSYNPKGIFLMGHTARGKTRTCWAALRAAHFAGRSIYALDGIRFANEAAKAASDPENTERWIGKLTRPDILFIDDLGKRFTKSSAPLLFGVVERRTSNQKPMIITTNLTADKIKDLIDDQELSIPLVRRIGEFFETVVL